VSDADGLPPRRAARAAYRGGQRLASQVYRTGDALIDQGQLTAFRFLWLFLPETSITRSPRFQAILASRFFSDAGQQALAYGALIAVVRDGGSALDAALIGVAALLPPALFGLYGGAVADVLPKRIALAGVYNLQALLCFVVPYFLGTEMGAMVLLLLLVNALGQVSQPTESSVLPLVTSEEQLATGASLISFTSSLGTAFGTAALAPVLVKAFGVNTVIYVAGAMLVIAASRVIDLHTEDGGAEEEEPIGIHTFVHRVSIRETMRWLGRQPAVVTMIALAIIAGTAQIVVQTLAPRYVTAVLQVDAADAVYVFAPSAAGLTLALAATPRIVAAKGERIAALVGFVITTAALILLGAVRHLEFVDAVNPLRLISLAGLELDRLLRSAMLLALPLGFGVALTLTSVQTYINRRVPLQLQGRTFAMQSVLKNGTAILPLLVLGAAAAEVGAETVLLASPLLLLALAVALIVISRRFGEQPARGLDVLATFWEEDPAELPLQPETSL
jgi:Na+/melibiose symporter-like transporter